jgi:hypothetical protein
LRQVLKAPAGCKASCITAGSQHPDVQLDRAAAHELGGACGDRQVRAAVLHGCACMLRCLAVHGRACMGVHDCMAVQLCMLTTQMRRSASGTRRCATTCGATRTRDEMRDMCPPVWAGLRATSPA